MAYLNAKGVSRLGGVPWRKYGARERARFGRRSQIAALRGRRDDLSDNAVMVIFHGKEDPDGPLAQSYDWVRDNYR